MSDGTITALRQALSLSPDNHVLRRLLAQTLAEAGRPREASDEYRALLEAGQLPTDTLLPAGEAALAGGELELARRCVHEARRQGVVEGVAPLESRINTRLAEGNVLRLVSQGPAPAGPPSVEAETERITFSDVGGLTGVKKSIHRTIILPFQRPELFRSYGRSAGGGVLLFGPPGCGKTMLARATAGECGLPFFNVRIEEVLDPFFGVSERNLHDAFEQARQSAPCVIFLDELDAIAFARRKHQGGGGRALVDQLLQELDGLGVSNRNLLILGATNAPWDVDEALKRPGRFDRVVFVPPPDAAARARILELRLAGRPQQGIDIHALAAKTALWSGADLGALAEAAVDEVIEEALASGAEPPVEMRHLWGAHASMRPSTLEWLARARNFVEFANQSGIYDEVAAYLRSPEARSVKALKS